MNPKDPTFDFQANCPLPLRHHANVVLGHGSGGRLSRELVEDIFLPAFANEKLEKLGDSAVFPVDLGNLAFTTDSFVVQPLFFPGGSIGSLAVNGTVNDLSMSGARPLYLSAGFIIEEGFPIEVLKRIADEMGFAAKHAGVSIIAGDTKVVERGHGDGCYINTAGVGAVRDGVNVSPSNARPGDIILINGTLGDHGMAIMSVREGLEFESQIKSDSAPLNRLVSDILDAYPDVHVMRDPTRGGLAASLHEVAESSGCGIELEESSIPIDPSVQSACEILGLDPMLVANEGKMICMVPAEAASEVLRVMKANPLGGNAAIIGRVVEKHRGLVVVKTTIGASRVVPYPDGPQLPRIC